MLSSDNILQSLVKVKSIEIRIISRNLDCDMYRGISLSSQPVCNTK